MADIWGGIRQREVHCNGAAAEDITASVVLDWTTVNAGTNSLSRYLRIDARAASVSIRVPTAPGAAHNGRKLKISIHPDDASTSNFRGVIFTGGNPIERGSLLTSNIYALNRRAGHIVLEVVNGVVRINSGAGFNDDPTLPANADLLAILNGWTTGATWAVAPDNANEAVVQFNANGIFFPSRALNAHLVAIAAGGGGGGGEANSFGGAGGGGGAGEYLDNAAFAITALSHAITIGAGGTGGTSAAADGSTNGANGGDTLFGALLTLEGGGAGGGDANTGGSKNRSNGANGGGGPGDLNQAGGTATAPGFAGGLGGGGRAAGGGGGAGGVGEAAQTDGTREGGDGGAGVSSSITGSAVLRGGGGGGGANSNGGSAAGGAAGTGGGGIGDTSAPNNTGAGSGGSNGTANTGGGGGGACGRNGFIGGSGVVILRVPLVAAIGL